MIQKIIILDFATGKVYVCDYDPNCYEDAQDFISEDPHQLGIKESNCQYMVVDSLNIEIL